MIEIRNPKMSYGIKFPTDVKELTEDVLTELTKTIIIPEYYAVVVMCYKTKLFNIAMDIKGGKSQMATVIPILGKVNDPDKKTTAKVGQRIVVDRTSLERGVHVNLPTAISSANVSSYLLFEDFANKLVTNKVDDSHASVIMLEAKIVPINNIYGAIDDTISVNDPFIVRDKTKDN